jgi:hypothetical protein
MVIDAVAVGTGTAAWFLNKIFGPSADLLGNDLADRFRKRRDRVIQRAAEIMQAEGVEPRQVPDEVLMPLLQGASLASAEEMQQLWTNLLASAANPNHAELPASFPVILSQLSPTDAKVLAGIYEVLQRIEVTPEEMTMRGASLESIPSALQITMAQTMISVENLIRLNLVAPPAAGFEFVENKAQRYQMQNRDLLCGTHLGWAFVAACSSKKTGGSDEESAQEGDAAAEARIPVRQAPFDRHWVR